MDQVALAEVEPFRVEPRSRPPSKHSHLSPMRFSSNDWSATVDRRTFGGCRVFLGDPGSKHASLDIQRLNRILPAGRGFAPDYWREIPFPPPNHRWLMVQATGWASRVVSFRETPLPFLMRRSSARLATAFALVAFKATLAVEIETMLVPVLGPLSFESFGLCWRRNAEPA